MNIGDQFTFPKDAPVLGYYIMKHVQSLSDLNKRDKNRNGSTYYILEFKELEGEILVSFDTNLTKPKEAAWICKLSDLEAILNPLKYSIY